VEKHIVGDDHRLLVVNGSMLMATRRLPGAVEGDGQRTVTQLIEQLNADPRRGTGKRSLMMRLFLDDEALSMLAEQALGPDSVPPRGQRVHLRRTANISTGGTAEDVSTLIHSDNRLLAERAARILGLDIAGVDFLCPDIARSWREVGGGICEVNAQPGFRPHWLSDPNRDINGEILDSLFSEGPPRIPTAAIAGAKGKTAVAQLLHRIWQQAGACTGLSCTEGVKLGEAWLHAKVISSANTACQMLLPDPALQSLVLEISAKELLDDGHPLDRYDVSALLNVQADLVAAEGAGPLSVVARLQAQVLQRTTNAVVLNADGAHCLRLGELPGLPPRVLVSASAGNAAVLAHLGAGGRAVWPQARGSSDWVCLAEGESVEFLMPLNDLAANHGGRCLFTAQNALFAIALAWAQGVPLESIRKALSPDNPTLEACKLPE
jgi:cyanophycin synthetase